MDPAGKFPDLHHVCEIFSISISGGLFDINNPNARLAVGDASYVEVIHTSTAGIEEPIGDADFYPNGGNNNPGCLSKSMKYNKP